MRIAIMFLCDSLLPSLGLASRGGAVTRIIRHARSSESRLLPVQLQQGPRRSQCKHMTVSE